VFAEIVNNAFAPGWTARTWLMAPDDPRAAHSDAAIIRTPM
jgi:hypothetical protein